METVSLNYKEFGQGEPIIILHGLFGTLDNWQTIAKKLAQNYTVYILDQRNHGRSPHHEVFNYQVMAADLQAFMENNWIYKATIIGHSMGGKTAMQFALDYEDMVEKLIVVDIAPKIYQDGHQTIFEALLSLDLANLDSRKEADAILQQKIEEFGVRQFLLKNLTRNKDDSYNWKMNLPVIYENYQSILDNIISEETCEAPTLFIRGEKSNYIQDEDINLIQQYFPNGKLQTVANSGHWVHAEQPKDLLAKITTFLDS